MLHRSLRNTAATVIDFGDEGQGGRLGTKGVRARGLLLAALFVTVIFFFHIFYLHHDLKTCLDKLICIKGDGRRILILFRVVIPD